MGGFLVGCPVSQRAWILPRWHEHVEAAAAAAGVEAQYLFVADPCDEDTVAIIEGMGASVVWVADGRPDDTRHWNNDRYRHLADLRNRLLEAVRAIDPDLFLSLDSDVLLHPEALPNMIESLARFDVVGGATYMTSTGTACPSWGSISRGGGLIRGDACGVFPVEVVMAIKLLTPRAFDVRYACHSHGEDLAFSINCREAGLRLGVDARVASKHVMSPAQLERIDVRCGF